MHRNRFWLVLPLTLFVLYGPNFPASAQKNTTSKKSAKSKLVEISVLPRISTELHRALQSQRHVEAIRLIDERLKQPGVKNADYLLYLKGRSQTELKLYDNATATFSSLERKYPKSRWTPRARFGRADVLVRQRNYREAGRIYQAEAERLLSGGRQNTLVAIYLEFADRYYAGVPAKGPTTETKPDFRQALTYYQQALELRSGLSRKQKIEFRIARCRQELKQYPQAIAAFRNFLRKYASKKTKDEKRVAAKLEVEARFQLGRALLSAGRAAEARKTWQDFLNSDAARQSGGDFIAQATYQIAKSYGIPRPPSVPNLELGVSAMKRFLKRFPKHNLAATAEFEIAQSYLAHGRFDQAIARLKSLIAKKPGFSGKKRMEDGGAGPNGKLSEQEAGLLDTIADARRLLGESYYAQKKFSEAIAAWKDFLEAHPTDSQWSAVQRRVIDAEYAAAAVQRAQKNYDAARKLWATFLNKYPLDARAASILFQFGAMKYNAALEQHAKNIKQEIEAGNKPDRRKLTPAVVDLFEQAIADWKRLVSKYPNTNDASHGAYMIGVALEDQLGKLADALAAYKKVRGQYQSVARKRIANLTAKQLEVVTERKFRTNEKPVIKVRTRNLENVTVKIYRIDMVDYFRKMHLASGVETLDIQLIDPDKTWENQVVDYEKYRQLTNDVEIPVEGPGVTAVTVSSDKLEATTMIIVSDIDVIVKASRNELFVFAENMRTQKPAAGVSLLVSDGHEVFAEEVTGKDGVLKKSYDKLKSAVDLRVFAVHEGHAASTVSSMQGLKFAVGLAPKGYLYTDRPAYRAGELVHLKGLVRWVNNDTYTFKAGEKYKLTVYDARGRVIYDKETTLNKFGTFSDRLMLPASSPQGNYRVCLHKPDGSQSYETHFVVHETKLEPVQLLIDLPRTVFYRGEKIEGKVTLKYYYGTPLADRTIQYRIANGPLQTATTDANGEVKFSFETTQYNESQQLPITAYYRERGLGARVNAFLATRGFAVGVKFRRGVYITGETFDTTVRVTDPAGKPVATELKLEVFQLLLSGRSNDGKSEKRIATHTVKTDKKTGEARQTLRIDKAGYYRVRATGTDRFQNPVSGSRMVRISGDDDAVRLRILSDKHQYKVGDDAKVQLHWREDPALALVTYEGAKVLGYRLVTLKKGSNPLTIPLAAHLAPNFVLSVTVMENNRFHKADSEFLVKRKLNIALKTNKSTLKPGDELKVTITTTDPQGKPVSAEVSLGLIQKNLLDRFSDPQAAIDAYFGGGYRQPSVRAFTSATFRYQPKTRGISQYLLAEAERQKILQMELENRKLLANAGELDRIRRLERNANRESSKRIAQGAFGQAEKAAQLAADLPPGTDRNQAQSLVGAYDRYFKQHRYKEAELIARQLQQLAPQSPVGESLYWKARFGRRIASSRRFELKKNSGAWRTLNEIEQSAIPLGGKFTLMQQNGQAGPAGGSQVFGGGQAGGFGAMPAEKPSSSAAQGGVQFNAPRGFGGGMGGGRPGDATRWSHRGESQTPGEAGKNAGQSIFYRMIVRENPNARIEPFQSNLSLVIRQEQSTPKLRTFLNDLANNTDGTIVALNDAGEYQVVNGLAVARLERMTKDGIRLLPGMGASETGYWNPTVVTGKDGRTVVSFQLPNRSTAWKLRAKGTDAGVLSGQAESEVIARKDLFGDVKTPLAFYQGDKANVIVEVHNGVVKKGETITVELTTKIGERSTKLTKTVKSTGPGITELSFPVDITKGDSAEFALKVASGKQTDTATASVPVRPFGLPVYATASGSAAQNTIAFVGHDKKLAVEDPTMEIILGPSVNRTLLDTVLGGPVIHNQLSSYRGSPIERNVSDTLGGVALLKMIRATRTTDTPEAQALAGRVQSALTSLVSSQRNDGGWSWAGKPTAGADRYLSSRVVWALATARRAGFTVPADTFNKAVQFLKTQFTRSNTADREGQAILLHGLAEAKAADFSFANRLYRERNNLSPSGLLHLALVLIRMDRKEKAADLLNLVDISIDRKRANRAAIAKVIPWMRSGVELRALYLLALQAVNPADQKLGKLADWLMAARVGSRWQPEKANGPAISALAEWFGRTKFTPEKYTLSVFVNSKLVEKIEVDPSKDASRTLRVPAKFLTKDNAKPQQVNFDITGRGRFSYSVVLGGFVPAAKLKSTSNQWTVKRYYEPAQRMLDGVAIPRGFGILTGSYRTFRNPLTQLPLGERGEVTLSISRHDWQGGRFGQRAYLVVTEPIPSGAMVLTESIKGGFDRYELSPGAITFYVGDRSSVGAIRYTLTGYLPGSFKAAPTVVRSFYQPEQIAVSSIKPLETLARGAKTKDKYRLSPVELYEFGKRLLAKDEFKAANEHLSQLFGNYRLRNNIFKDVVQMLFRTSLANKTNDTVVKYFEILKEKYPDVEIDFDAILQVANAYRQLGEYERGYLVYRATIEASFLRESQIAGFLDKRGEFLRSVQVLERLLADYPAEPYVALSTYALAQEVYGKAAEVAKNQKLRDAGLTRVNLISTSIRMIDHFISTWPKDPAADQAAFSIANSLLDLERYKAAIARCELFADRYPESKLLDSYWYVIGYSQFALGRHDAALKTCEKVAETKRKDPATGIEVAAANKWQAIYIMGQIYHSLGKPAQAITEYKRVKGRFPDAGEAIDFFTRKNIKLPEVTSIKPGDAVKVPLKFRNVPAANVKVYRIDLLKFGLMQRNLNRITAINLAGIRPYHELTLKLGDGHDYRDRKESLALPLKEEGAYLVVCRGENLYTSGLVLVSPLALEIQEDATSGRVRVTVKNKVADKYADNVHVKVIGSANREFVSGETDLRGIFVADGIRGTSTVIARADKNRYAFYRGKTALGSAPRPTTRTGSPQAPNTKPGGKGGYGKGELLKNLQKQNTIFNREQRGNYRMQLDNKAKGVQIKKAF